METEKVCSMTYAFKFPTNIEELERFTKLVKSLEPTLYKRMNGLHGLTPNVHGHFKGWNYGISIKPHEADNEINFDYQFHLYYEKQ